MKETQLTKKQAYALLIGSLIIGYFIIYTSLKKISEEQNKM